MIEAIGKELVLDSIEGVKEELADYLRTYLKQHNQMVATYEWIKDKLNTQQKNEWSATIDGLSVVVRALYTGFDPITPPRNWASGQLVQYIAPIPEHVREAIDKAEPIFGQGRILIYDPNEKHFRRPRKTDPMAIGFVNLADQRIHFLIGQWDLEADLKFITHKESRSRPIDRSAERVGEVITITTPWVDGSQYVPWTTASADVYTNLVERPYEPLATGSSDAGMKVRPSAWSAYMAKTADSFALAVDADMIKALDK